MYVGGGNTATFDPVDFSRLLQRIRHMLPDWARDVGLRGLATATSNFREEGLGYSFAWNMVPLSMTTTISRFPESFAGSSGKRDEDSSLGGILILHPLIVCVTRIDCMYVCVCVPSSRYQAVTRLSFDTVMGFKNDSSHSFDLPCRILHNSFP